MRKQLLTFIAGTVVGLLYKNRKKTVSFSFDYEYGKEIYIVGENGVNVTIIDDNGLKIKTFKTDKSGKVPQIKLDGKVELSPESKKKLTENIIRNIDADKLTGLNPKFTESLFRGE